MDMRQLSQRPLKMRHNRVWRPYSGGLLLDQWQGRPDPKDAYVPEEWVSSAVAAKNVHPIPNEGLSMLDLPDGSSPLLADVIASDPAGFLGTAHAACYGTQMAVLIKMIDSSIRLVIQVHPDKPYARMHLNSDYGKTEAWYILGGRSVDGVEPHVLMGFKPGVTREIWADLFARQDVDGMIDAMHRIPVKPGDGFLIEGGLPHAIGAGCFLIEIQEPTDLTMRFEKLVVNGEPMPEAWCTQGLGVEKMLDCFHYDTFSLEEIIRKCAIRTECVRDSADGTETLLVFPTESPLFGMRKIDVVRHWETQPEEAYSVVVVVDGCGRLAWDGGELAIAASDELFLPASLGRLTWHNDNGAQPLQLIRCHPPKP